MFFGKDWDDAMPGHHEDPLHMRFGEVLHLAHKYYFRVITHKVAGDGMSRHFNENQTENSLSQHPGAGESITLSAGGDLMPYKCMDKETCATLWDECGDFFFGADIVTANLETPFDLQSSPSAVPEVMLKNMYFNGSAEMFDVFSGMGRYKGYDVLSAANNHSLDQGEAGLIRTLNFLEQKGIHYSGAAASKKALNDFPVVEKKGIRVAFLAATFSLNALNTPPGKEWIVNHLPLNSKDPDISLLVQQAEIARRKGADLIAAHLHMGLAYQPYPVEDTVNTMHHICRQTGIDIILGGHPHNAQPFELYSYTDPFTNTPKQSVIVYSLGDFIAYDIFKWCHLPLMLKFTISKGKSGTYITGMQAKLAYMQAGIRKGKVISLKLRDYKSLVADRSDLDEDSLKEFKELEEFAGQFLLPGNVGRFLV
jgi:poly-gamma-glutamate synthesis protein (capsule biosynthesis protein)